MFDDCYRRITKCGRIVIIVLYCIVLYCIYLSSALFIKTKKSKIYMQNCSKTANAETSGLMGNPIIGLKSITSGDRFMSPRTKLKS